MSHAIGTELIEPPFLSEKEELLQPGIFFTLEPQMIRKDEFTICLASLFQITATGTLLLTETPVKIMAFRRNTS